MRERTEVLARTPVRQRLIWTVAGFGTLAFAACLFGPLVGSTRIHLSAVFDRSIPYADNVDAQIFFVARLPRVLAAALVGSALALSGVVFQALLRNPLASPDTLGVSAGAALGAMMAITFNFDFSLLGISAVPLASFAGSFGALLIVYGLSTARRRGTSTIVLLLGGVTVQALLSAVIAFVQYLADFTQTFRNVRWLMGSLDVWRKVIVVADAGDATPGAHHEQHFRRRRHERDDPLWLAGRARDDPRCGHGEDDEGD